MQNLTFFQAIKQADFAKSDLCSNYDLKYRKKIIPKIIRYVAYYY